MFASNRIDHVIGWSSTFGICHRRKRYACVWRRVVRGLISLVQLALRFAVLRRAIFLASDTDTSPITVRKLTSRINIDATSWHTVARVLNAGDATIAEKILCVQCLFINFVSTPTASVRDHADHAFAINTDF